MKPSPLQRPNAARCCSPAVEWAAPRVGAMAGQPLRPSPLDMLLRDIFHFVGHAAGDGPGGQGALLLADDYGDSSPLGAAQLGRLVVDRVRTGDTEAIFVARGPVADRTGLVVRHDRMTGGAGFEIDIDMAGATDIA